MIIRRVVDGDQPVAIGGLRRVQSIENRVTNAHFTEVLSNDGHGVVVFTNGASPSAPTRDLRADILSVDFHTVFGASVRTLRHVGREHGLCCVRNPALALAEPLGEEEVA